MKVYPEYCRPSTSAPGTPATPGCPVKGAPFSALPTIEESRGSLTNSSVDQPLIPQKTDWTSIRLITVVVLLTRIQFTVYFASLFPFMREVRLPFSGQQNSF